MSWLDEYPLQGRKDHISHTKTGKGRKIIDSKVLCFGYRGICDRSKEGILFFQGSWNITKQCIVIFGISFKITIYCLIQRKWVPFNDRFSLGRGRNGSYLKSRCRVVSLDPLILFLPNKFPTRKKQLPCPCIYIYIYILQRPIYHIIIYIYDIPYIHILWLVSYEFKETNM